jgi:hypothetical protein
VATTLAISYLPVCKQQRQKLSLVALLLVMKQLQTLSACLHLKTKLSNNHFMNVNSNQTASQQNMKKKTSCLKNCFFYSHCH